MVASPDLSVFGKLRSFDDYERLQQEFDMQKAAREQAAQIGALQIQQAQKQLATPDLEALAQQSLYAYHQGQPLSPEGKAALETLATMKGETVQFKPDEFGNVRAFTEPNPYQQFLGNVSTPVSYGTGDPLTASRNAITQRQGNIEVQPLDLAGVEAQIGDMGASGGQMMGNSPALTMGGANKDDLSVMAFSPEYAPQLDAEIMNSPYGRKKIFEDQLARDTKKTEADISASARGAETYAAETAKVEAAKPKKLAAIERVKGNLVEAEKTLSSLPQGMIEQMGQFVTGDIMGYSTEAGEELSKVDVLLPSLVADIKQLVREPGEGTFTDRDQALIESMAFDPYAPLKSKIASFNTLKGVMQRYEQSLVGGTINTAAPGWAHLGVK